ncbi:hypothetical protein PIB30_062687 [Stylosanthes scabra]|uniref:Uncharacterized protein n=1 Tax=Stylosanthes scabra TaxID=79078 RepID=A0ABU6XJT5_9FABA|nr:hypothetical protein [Stylosanthes scabra]
MALDVVKCNVIRKRKRASMKRKLLVDDRVEVRSVEDGFMGSWHPGTVIQSGKQKRHVRYDNVLEDDGSNYVVDVVAVSPVVDGGVSYSNNVERGYIRPIPPLFEFGGWDLPFGLCVDVSYQEAWWEGVVFDHCNGMDERRVFFPDLGDEMKVGINNLRITHDWDEFADDWKPRGKWVFLELIEECERLSYVAVSVKQIWYDVRVRKEFDSLIRDWTCDEKELWRDLVMEVAGDYYALTLQDVLAALNLEMDFSEEAPRTELVEATANADGDYVPAIAFGSCTRTTDTSEEKGDSADLMDCDKNSGSIDPIQKENNMDTLIVGASNDQNMAELNMNVPEEEDVMSREPISPIQQIFPEDQKRTASGRRVPSSVLWKPLVLSEVEFCPEIIQQYTLGCESKKVRELLKTKVRKHLAYIGWTIEVTEDRYLPGRHRYRYKPPGEQGAKFFTSIAKACRYIKQNDPVVSQNDLGRMHDMVDGSILNLLSDQSRRNQVNDSYSSMVASSSSAEAVVEPEFFPEAVVKYYLHALENHHANKRKWKLKAKQHLLAEGWVLDYPTEKRRRMLYHSPKNQTLGTLQGACRRYIKESIPKWMISGIRPLNLPVGSEESVHRDDLVSLLLQREPELHDGLPVSTSNGNRSENHPRSRNPKNSSRKRQGKGVPTRVLRSSKRVQKVLAPGLLHQKPQNILSWLIDNNILSTRYKVYCRGKHGKSSIEAEGRISREGIKCCCCQEMYSLCGFANHADANSNHRPSASIFLKDGRSLLDCQIQVMQDKRKEENMKKQSNDLCQGENDNICSVCQYGGELVLCDQCPSAFHMSCIGLADLPDGDWFCPSCRCGICSQSKIKGDEDGHFLNCIQCERKYHLGCLGNRTVDELRHMAKWFCGNKCEQIYTSLQKLLGKSISVDANNLTWTLVKSFNSENCDVDSAKDEYLAESYSKLNIALSVMHECFEPLQNASSSRDLMEDVIFSRWSELNRTNFQGFYTVLLERNEELISVATFRVYGEKVAEVPLVGTRFQYRRLGMCRVLMNELEKMLSQLGVERLVLPAVPSVLDTWTNSFGFDPMTEFQRSQFLDYTFLDFQGTTMCQKLLRKESQSPDSVITREIQPASGSVKCKIDFEKFSSGSDEVYRAEDTDETRMTNTQMEYFSPLSTMTQENKSE